jgi:hypothetical protein
MREVYQKFDGPLLQRISEEIGIAADKMFMSCPSEKFPHDIAQLGRVRLITS